MNSKLLTLLNPVLTCIDNGHFFRKPVQWLYVAIGVLNFLLPFTLLFKAIDSGMLNVMSGKYIFFFILFIIILIALAWGSYLLWMNRKDKLKQVISEENEFIAIPIMAHFTQTLGEWLGLYIGIGGFIFSLIMAVSNMEIDLFGTRLFPWGFGVSMCFLYPIYGFLIVISGRVLAELYRAFATIAYNIKTIANNTKKDEALVHTEKPSKPEVDNVESDE